MGRLATALAALCLCASAGLADAKVIRYEPSWDGHFSFAAGLRDLGSDWKGARRLLLVGWESEVHGVSWPVGIATDFFFATEDQEKVEGTVFELDLGLRKVFHPTWWIWPHLGGGWSVAHAKATVESGNTKVTGKDTATGWWGSAGLLFPIDRKIYTGVSFRHSAIQAKLNGIGGGETTDVGGNALLLTVGGYW